MLHRNRDARNVALGLVGGAMLALAMGQAAAPDRRQTPVRAQPVQRYQITAMRDNPGNEYLFILDHETQKVYRRSTDGIAGNSPTVEQLIQSTR